MGILIKIFQALEKDISNFINLLLSQQAQKIFLPLKIVLLVISFYFIGFIIFVLVKTRYLERLVIRDIINFFTLPTLKEAKELRKKWKSISQKLETGKEADYKLAVIEAHKMMEEKLTEMGYEGESLKERLEKVSEEIMPNLKEVKKVAQIRDNIVYDPDYKLTLDEAKKIIEVFYEGLRYLYIVS